MGRCGSTLLSNASNELNNVISLSEPDVFFNITGLREANKKRDKELVRLSKSCLKFLCNSSTETPPDTWVVKFRGFSTEIADLVQQATSNARHIFLYRNAEVWAKSIARLTRLTRTGGLEQQPLRTSLYGYPIERFISYVSHFNSNPYPDAKPHTLSRLENFALTWLSIMNCYLEHYNAGIPFAALRYEDLGQPPDKMLKAVFEYCQLPNTEIGKAKQAFGRDSQAGTRFSGKANRQDKTLELSDEHLEQVRAILRHHPVLNRPDVRLPGTLET